MTTLPEFGGEASTPAFLAQKARELMQSGDLEADPRCADDLARIRALRAEYDELLAQNAEAKRRLAADAAFDESASLRGIAAEYTVQLLLVLAVLGALFIVAAVRFVVAVTRTLRFHFDLKPRVMRIFTSSSSSSSSSSAASAAAEYAAFARSCPSFSDEMHRGGFGTPLLVIAVVAAAWAAMLYGLFFGVFSLEAHAREQLNEERGKSIGGTLASSWMRGYVAEHVWYVTRSLLGLVTAATGLDRLAPVIVGFAAMLCGLLLQWGLVMWLELMQRGFAGKARLVDGDAGARMFELKVFVAQQLRQQQQEQQQQRRRSSPSPARTATSAIASRDSAPAAVSATVD